MPDPFSRRNMIMRFSAHVAMLLNSGKEFTELEDSAVYSGLIEMLSGGRGPRSKVYSQYLAGHALVQHRFSAEETALIYFERMLERRLFLARDNPHHKGHELLHALCRRGAGKGWDQVTLARSLESSSIVPFNLPEGFKALKVRLAGCPSDISKGNPAASARASQGPLYITFSGARIELPEELPLWSAIRGAPKKLHTLSGRDWVEFRNLVIRGFETANAPFAALLSIGLWPPDWDGALSIYQVKQLSAFLSLVRKNAEGNTLPAWRHVWAAGKKVSGFKSADELWDSDLGAALRGVGLRIQATGTDISDVADTGGEEDEPLDENRFGGMLELCRKGGAIDDVEAWLYLQIFDGRTADDLEKEPRMRKRLRERQCSMADYLEALQTRVHAYVRGLDRNHPDNEDGEEEDD
jgi:hypothetical protein